MSRVARYFSLHHTSRAVVRDELAKRGMSPLGFALPGMSPERYSQVALEHQHGMYRVFHLATRRVLVSHECRTEAIRRAEVAGFVFVGGA